MVRQSLWVSYYNIMSRNRDKYELEIVDNIRRYRMAKGLTQEELARLCGLSTSYIGDIETYRRFPKILNLKKIADALDIDIAYLVSRNVVEKDIELSDYIDKLKIALDEVADQSRKPNY